ncbi:MAG TPA: ABC transporter ATP-binding protein [Nitrososphaeraceae archaeon]|jgi:ABC-2 type transport system ATP-binding protein
MKENADRWCFSKVQDNSISTLELTKVYGNFRAVDSLTIDIRSGDIVGFLGPNGAGKTTTIRMLCGLLSPSKGNATIAGLDVMKDNPEIRRIVGLLPESSGFYNWMNAKEYLLHFAALYKIESHFAESRIAALLKKVGLANKSFAPISYYSRGMKQRLALARTLINNPRIIFLDEPTLGLDPKGQQDIQEILLDLNKSKNVTIFLSSHAISEVSSLCNTIAIVNRGKLIANGTIEELRNLAGDSNDLVHITVFNSQNTSYALSKLPVDNIIRYKGNDTDRRFKTVVVDPKRGDSSLNEIIKSFDKIGLQIYEIRRVNIGLEEIFFKLTEKSRSNANYNISQQDNFRGRRQLSYLPDQHDAATDQFGIEPQ